MEEPPANVDCGTEETAAAVISTPVRQGRPVDMSPVLILHGRNFLRRKYKPMRLNYSVPEEPNNRTEFKWRITKAKLLRFVDDGFSMPRINYENSFGFTVNGIKPRSNMPHNQQHI